MGKHSDGPKTSAQRIGFETRLGHLAFFFLGHSSSVASVASVASIAATILLCRLQMI
jgi:hypothetical protein